MFLRTKEKNDQWLSGVLPVTIPEVFAKANSDQFPSRFLSGELKSRQLNVVGVCIIFWGSTAEQSAKISLFAKVPEFKSRPKR